MKLSGPNYYSNSLFDAIKNSDYQLASSGTNTCATITNKQIFTTIYITCPVILFNTFLKCNMRLSLNVSCSILNLTTGYTFQNSEPQKTATEQKLKQKLSNPKLNRTLNTYKSSPIIVSKNKQNSI